MNMLFLRYLISERNTGRRGEKTLPVVCSGWAADWKCIYEGTRIFVTVCPYLLL